ncbi:MAG TPA: TGS domain-containing protein, partial [Phototrophicaceae bacterium]|nr:TGS domain-containing protein [Phototrophicaceae bacterium]
MTARDADRTVQDPVAQARTVFESQIHDPVVIQHVQEMHRLLSFWQARTPVLIAAWLLVIVRNELLPDSKLIPQFGQRTLQIARLAGKLIFSDPGSDSNRRGTPTQRSIYADLARKLFVYAYGDFEAVLITIADQIATAVQYQEMLEPQRQEWAQRNQAVFIPVLEMLGLWTHRSELGNLSLYILNRPLYEQLENQVKLYEEKHRYLYNTLTPDLEKSLVEHHISNPEIHLHLTSPSSLYKRIEKLKKRGEQPGAGLDEAGSLSIDVLVKDEIECYIVLGVIHNLWRPALRRTSLNGSDSGTDSRFRDFIATPRYNGYRCLITTVLCDLSAGEANNHNRPQQHLVEFRIRTHQMEEVNTLGIAAAVLNPISVRYSWWTNQAVRDMVKPGTTDFLKSISEICVFTPTGEVIYPLQLGSTMIDLAFKIHSSLGAYAKAFWANGKPVPLDYQLRHRDLVEVEYDLHYPTIQT